MGETLFLLFFLLSWFWLTRAARRWPWLGILFGVVFAAPAVVTGRWFFNGPDGSLGGGFLWGLSLLACTVASGLALWYLSLGVQGLFSSSRGPVSEEEELPWRAMLYDDAFPFSAICFIGGVILLVAFLITGMVRRGHVDTALRPPVASFKDDAESPEGALRELRAWLDGKAGQAKDRRARAVSDRDILEHCKAELANPERAFRLNVCADGLVEAWDQSLRRKKPFAGEPGAEFAAAIGEMYVRYAEATREYVVGIVGIRGVQRRVAQAFPHEGAVLERLGAQEAQLRGDAR